VAGGGGVMMLGDGDDLEFRGSARFNRRMDGRWRAWRSAPVTGGATTWAALEGSDPWTAWFNGKVALGSGGGWPG